jgi:hypothetical protein
LVNWLRPLREDFEPQIADGDLDGIACDIDPDRRSEGLT